MFPLMRPSRKADRRMVRRGIDPFHGLRDELDVLFEPFALPEDWAEPYGWNVEEMEKEWVCRLDLPGFEPGEIAVTAEGDELVVRAAHTEAPATKESKESRRRAFTTRVTVPRETDLDKVEAVYRNGVLELHVPRAPGVQARRIEVKT